MADGNWEWRGRTRYFVYLTLDDAWNLSTRLESAFPGIKFVPYNYEWYFVDHARWQREVTRFERLRKYADVPHYMDDPTGKELPYLGSFAAKRWTTPIPGHAVTAWIEPEGWSPIWLPHLDELHKERYFVVNEPTTQFSLSRSEFHCPGRPRFIEDPPKALHPREKIYLNASTLSCKWPKGDDEAKRLGEKLWRFAGKFFTTKTIAVDAETFRPWSFEATASYATWVGPDAAAWACKRRHNYLGDEHRPEKPEGYKFPKGTKLHGAA